MIIMSGRIKIYLIVFSLLFLTTLIFILSDRGSTLKLKTSGFAVDDVEKLTTIELRKGDKEVVLSKEGTVWVVDHSYLADQQLMITFLRAMGNLRVKSPVPLSDHEKILEKLQTAGVEVSIHKRWTSRKLYVWYEPGQPSYMLLGNSKSPFIMEVPGLKGEVGEMFVVNNGFWRENVLLSYPPERIKQVSVNYPGEAQTGFEIQRTGEKKLVLLTESDAFDHKEAADSLLYRYLTYFSYIPYKDIVDPSEKALSDSLKAAIPFCTIVVENLAGERSQLELHLKRSSGMDSSPDPDLLYGLFNNRRDLALVSFVSIDLLLRDIHYFYPPSVK
jgi:hypothetical protein